MLSFTGAKLVGAEAIVPQIVAPEGVIAGPAADAGMIALARFGLETARAIGALDIGQAAIVSPGRIIAVEDVAGTDALLERVAGYRQAGFDADGILLLAKSLKPQQSKLVDRPAIGPRHREECGEGRDLGRRRGGGRRHPDRPSRDAGCR